MQIKRDYSEPFFRDKPKNHRRTIIFVLGFIALLGFIGYTQIDQIEAAAYNLINEAPTPTPMPNQYAQWGAEAYLIGDLELSAENYEKAVRAIPDNISYLYEYGQILIDLDDPDTAMQMADRIIELDATDVRGYALRTRALVWQGTPAAAIPVGLTGLELNPNFAPLWAALSRAYIGDGRYQEGLDAGLRAIELSPNDVRTHWAYGSALTSVAERELAIVELEIATEIHPTFLPPYFELAFLYLSLDQDQDAIATYDQILSMDPRNARANLRQCEAYRKVGEFERAIGFCEDAVTADPTYVPALFRLGLFRYSRREFAPAQEAFQACVDIDPGNLECTYRLGLTHYYLEKDCATSWELLRDSLVMAQALEDSGETVENIRMGMNAIANDPECPGFRLPSSQQPQTEAEGA